MFESDAGISKIKIPVGAWVLVGLLSFWQLSHWIFNINSIILPSPIEIIGAFGENFFKLFLETGITLLEALLGFVLGSSIAYLLAIIFIHYKMVQDAVYPYAVALKSTPLIAIAPLLVIWFGNGMFKDKNSSAHFLISYI